MSNPTGGFFGGWIPVWEELPRKREVLGIATATGLDTRTVIGTLVECWLWAQSESADGLVPDLTVTDLAHIFPATNASFWEVMIRFGWLEARSDGLFFPNAERWMTSGAKARLLKNRRQSRWRESHQGGMQTVPRETPASNGRPKKTLQTDADFLASLKANPAYAGIDIDRELGLMDAWILAHPGRQKTRPFVVNWLKKVDRPLPGTEPELTMWDTAPRVWGPCEGNPNCPEKGYHLAKNPKSVPLSKRCPLLPASEPTHV